jgi:AraC family transcriptional regulator, regulatory protein of adaptative response / DNA-3-methyladenine glycosylase II
VRGEKRVGVSACRRTTERFTQRSQRSEKVTKVLKGFEYTRNWFLPVSKLARISFAPFSGLRALGVDLLYTNTPTRRYADTPDTPIPGHLHVRKRRDKDPVSGQFRTVQLNRDQCYQAIITRDPRFDGHFFVAVRSTRIYCRPICRSKRPAIERCEFFRHAAAAEVAGYRPCLRCRPELAPGQAPADAADRLTLAAVRQIEAGSLRDQSVSDLAARLGVSDRHLRRVLVENLGVTPIQLAQTHKLLLAKQLLTDTALPIIDVAFASGFSSLRRFNALFRQRYSFAPKALRQKRRAAKDLPAFVCRLFYRPPFDWHSLLAFFSPRVFVGVEQIDGEKYRRTVAIGPHQGWISVENRPAQSALRIEVSISLLPVLVQVLARLRRLFDLEATPQQIATHLGALAENHPGLRVPGAFDGFEMAVRAILGQQISVKAATTLAGRLTNRFGCAIVTPFPGLTHLAPTAPMLAAAGVGDLAQLGITQSRARSILAMAQAVARGSISLDAAVSIEGALARLKELPGIGDWTVHYFAMRVFGWPDAFPHSDLGILKALKTKNPRRALALAEVWRPWRAYAAMHLWKSLEKNL